MAYRVFVPDFGTFEAEADETIVEAASRQGIAFPFSCHSGTCGTCKSLLKQGEVQFLDYSRFTLTDDERAAGRILACCTIPQSDCALELLKDINPIPAKRIRCKVSAIEDATHDIKIVKLSPLGGSPIRFLAGQFADLTFPGLPPRSYSIASRPGQLVLEFHIRLKPEGRVSPYVHDSLLVDQVVEFNGPLGTSYLREDLSEHIIALAGGSGLGPIKSIVDTLIARKAKVPISVYFGVRDERDLYYSSHFEEHARLFQNIVFIPVLSEPAQATSRRTGFLSDVVSADFTSVAGFKAYLAGPPAMIDTCHAVLKKLGLREGDFHADAFS